jgi:hypothetical protein
MREILRINIGLGFKGSKQTVVVDKSAVAVDYKLSGTDDLKCYFIPQETATKENPKRAKA